MLTQDAIAAALTGRSPRNLPARNGHKSAAVALILQPTAEGGDALLYIERACHPGDPWSGNLGFPGGRIDAGDRDARAAAERETREEVAIDLAPARFLGQLDDEYGVRVPVRVSAFVFGLTGPATVCCNSEAVRHFWVPLTRLCDVAHHGTRTVDWHGQPLQVPAIAIAAEAPPLWGLTYRFTRQLLHWSCRGHKMNHFI
ncbi:NUDIX hydrolase [Desulfuromonas thiophila]|uniref:NUDIX hydrolase n=1 Tax=Desulfuromonas thiophila TaxID=57664 RepID=UPI0024A7B4B1|nr:NUDIX domain-containing protein [Desulfuromonas thiophila]